MILSSSLSAHCHRPGMCVFAATSTQYSRYIAYQSLASPSMTRAGQPQENVFPIKTARPRPSIRSFKDDAQEWTAPSLALSHLLAFIGRWQIHSKSTEVFWEDNSARNLSISAVRQATTWSDNDDSITESPVSEDVIAWCTAYVRRFRTL